MNTDGVRTSRPVLAMGGLLVVAFGLIFTLAGGIEDRLFLAGWGACLLVGLLASRGRGRRCIAWTVAGSAIAAAVYGASQIPAYPDQVMRARVGEALPSAVLLIAPALMGVALCSLAGLLFGALARGLFERSRIWLIVGACTLAAIVASVPLLGRVAAATRPGALGYPPPLKVGDYRQYEPVSLGGRSSAKPPASSRESFRRVADLAYGPDPVDHRLDLYLPRAANGPSPVVVWIHGGGWMGGSKDDPSDGFPGAAAWLVPLLERGFAIASINYRLALDMPGRASPGAPFPAQIRDAKAAVRFLRANASSHGLDPERIGVMGHSAGGTLAALLAVGADVPEFDAPGPHRDVSGRVQAAVGISGVYDIRVYYAQSAFNARCLNLPSADYLHFAPPGSAPTSGISLGCSAAEFPALADLASPARHASRDDSPTLIVHGFRDLVPVHQAEYFHCELRRRGVDSTLLIVPGAGHSGPELTEAMVPEIVKFFCEKLDNK